jgi:hypothetical protein
MRMHELHKLVLGSLLALPALFSTISSSAWQHPVNAPLTYYIPGPPPGSDWGICKVETQLLQESTGPVALIKPVRASDSGCKPGSRGVGVKIWTAIPGVDIFGGSWGFSTDDWPGMSVGPSDQVVFGADFTATNVFGYAFTWNTGIFP